MRAATAASGAIAGLVAAALIVACSKQTPRTQSDERFVKLGLITQLWMQIRGFRAEAGMELDPPQALELQWRGKTVNEASRVCPDGHDVPKACGEVCSLAENICDNAEAICGLADELGKDDRLAQEKCTSAKASCREAKQRCCACSAAPPDASVPPAGVKP
ncbi:MAG TPA: hypothetical protein VFQ53_11910 [Kofleriaceae bacterium]|nr:hypothetical protein [Kofleriaceae bacterium]